MCNITDIFRYIVYFMTNLVLLDEEKCLVMFYDEKSVMLRISLNNIKFYFFIMSLNFISYLGLSETIFIVTFVTSA